MIASGRIGASCALRGICITLASLGMTHCATEKVVTTDGRPLPPEPREVPAAPQELKPNRIAFLVGSKPQDSNGNGYPDQIHTTVFLFSTPYPISLHEPGTFIFELYQKGGVARQDEAPLRQWRIPSSVSQQAKSDSQYGPCYQFELSLLDGGNDLFPLCALDLAVLFQADKGGQAVYGEGVKSIQVGRREAAVHSGGDDDDDQQESWGSRIRTLTN